MIPAATNAGTPSSRANPERRVPYLAFVLAAVVVAAPFLSRPLALVPGSLLARRYVIRLPWPEILACLQLFLFARAFRQGRPVRLPGTGLAPPVVWVSWLVVTTAAAPFRTLSVAGASGVLALTLVAWMAATAWDDGIDQRFRVAWAWGAALMALGVLSQHLAGGDAWGTFGNRNYVAGYLAASLPIGIVAAGRRRAAAVAFAAAILAALWATRSRGAFLAVIVVAIVAGVVRIRRSRMRWLSVAGILAAIVVAAVSQPGRNAIARVATDDVRVAIWPSAVRAVVDRPLLGWGPGSFRAVFPLYRTREYLDRPDAVNATQHAHNEAIEWAVETGVPGVLAWVWLLACGARGWRRQGRRVAVYGAAASILLLHNMVDVNMRYPPNALLFWFLLGRLWGPGCVVRVPRRARIAAVAPAAACLVWFGCGVIAPLASDLRVRSGLLARDVGDFTAAKRAYDRALEANPFNDNTWYKLAFVCTRDPARWPEAESAYREAARLAPNHADASHNLGVLLLQSGRPAQAVPWFLRACAFGPDPMRDLCWLGRARLAAGDLPGAAEAVRRLLEERPGDPCGEALVEEAARQLEAVKQEIAGGRSPADEEQ